MKWQIALPDQWVMFICGVTVGALIEFWIISRIFKHEGFSLAVFVLLCVVFRDQVVEFLR